MGFAQIRVMVQSIYDRGIQNLSAGNLERHCRRRARAETRLQSARIDPDARKRALLGCLESANRGELEPLLRRGAALRTQLIGLRIQVQRDAPGHRRDAERIRCALELLRGYGQCLAVDLSTTPDQARPALVELLRLEHELCYAAAGTTRADFEREVGRTGAR